ncbi:MAG: hypothetical protein IH855_02945 [Bacteroidetes bacterium]|nr:hypothetical protein [Bacteroidota bacterium]
MLYSGQPDYPLGASFLAALPNPPVTIPPEDGTYLAYLDVWDRHLTALEAPHIREVALGDPDTATRVKNVWQVKLHRLTDAEAAAAPDCLSDIPSWNEATAPSTGELSARAEPGAPSDDPCIVAPGAATGGSKINFIGSRSTREELATMPRTSGPETMDRLSLVSKARAAPATRSGP